SVDEEAEDWKDQRLRDYAITPELISRFQIELLGSEAATKRLGRIGPPVSGGIYVGKAKVLVTEHDGVHVAVGQTGLLMSRDVGETDAIILVADPLAVVAAAVCPDFPPVVYCSVHPASREASPLNRPAGYQALAETVRLDGRTIYDFGAPTDMTAVEETLRVRSLTERGARVRRVHLLPGEGFIDLLLQRGTRDLGEVLEAAKIFDYTNVAGPLAADDALCLVTYRLDERRKYLALEREAGRNAVPAVVAALAQRNAQLGTKHGFRDFEEAVAFLDAVAADPAGPQKLVCVDEHHQETVITGDLRSTWQKLQGRVYVDVQTHALIIHGSPDEQAGCLAALDVHPPDVVIGGSETTIAAWRFGSLDGGAGSVRVMEEIVARLRAEGHSVDASKQPLAL
ncbi:MAG: hypothetical protein H5U40_02930, partial [Polyangiaceae bacterium]|nr:hypothetical protein [Polyangiaceae bacterium]